MSRPSRRPLYSIVVLLCVTCAIYYVATGDTQSLGRAGPLTSHKLSPEMEIVESNRAEFQPAEKPVKPKPAEEVLTAFSDESVSEDSALGSDSKVKSKLAQLSENKGGNDGDVSSDGPKNGGSSNGGSSNGDSNTGLLGNSAADGFTETPFMPKMANETLKAKLGNSAWHLFHTVLARYPDKPTILEKTTLKLYIHLFAQVYPCGDCARHFLKLLAKYPVQVESRKTAALWGCHIHNKVNERLDKPEYDCTKILEDYDCGCGSDEQEEDYTLGNESLDRLKKVTLDEKEGKQLGG